MGKMQLGSGSEWHLLRMLGRHRGYFDHLIAQRIQADGGGNIGRIEWLDFPPDSTHPLLDGEHLAVDFIGDQVFDIWKQFWPDGKAGQLNRKGQPSWDAVGRGRGEWLLVEAKANETEFNRNTPCGASEKSRQKIVAAMQATRAAIGADEQPWENVEGVWLGHLYQTANRLACLHFVRNVLNQPGRLILVYFIGDKPGPTSPRICPNTSGRWEALIAAAQIRMGLSKRHSLSAYIHHVVINVAAEYHRPNHE